MINPNIPNMPGFGVMTDSLEFVKNLWGSMGIPGTNIPGASMPNMQGMPGMVMPTLSLEEINKKIADLKAVESWLALNMNMLRTTIQALEVQSATIATLQTMGQNFAASIHSPISGATPNGAYGSNGTRASQREEQTQDMSEPSKQDVNDAAALTAPLVNAAAWWNMLQEQFTQAVSGAMNEMTQEAAELQEKAKTAAKPKPAKSAPAKTTRRRKTD